MSDDPTKIVKFPGSGVLVDAQGTPIAPPVDDDVKSEVTRALADPYVRKLIATQVTGYHLYAAARDLLEKTDYSVEAKRGLIAATFHELFDPDTKMCRPFDFGNVRDRVKNTVIPFLPIMAGKFMAQQEQAKQRLLEADRKLRETPIPFFKALGQLERGEVYVFWTKPGDVAKAMELIAALMSKNELGLLWLSQYSGDSSEFKDLQRFLGQDVNIAPADAADSAFTTQRNKILNLPLMHLIVTDGPDAVLGTRMGDKSIIRFRQGLIEKKMTAVVVLPDGEAWEPQVGLRGALFLNPDPDVYLEDSLTAMVTIQASSESQG